MASVFDEHVYAGFRRADVGLKRGGLKRETGRDRQHRGARLAQMLVSGAAGVERAEQVDIDRRP